MARKRYWLFKSEPSVFSIDDLAEAPKKTTLWEGVRNYKARNFLRDEVQEGDLVLYHHSNASPPGVAGVARVVRAGYPDPVQFDAKSKYHDPKATKDAPRWWCVDVQFVERFDEVVALGTLKETPGLEDMMVVKRGVRLSIQPVTAREFEIVRRLGRLSRS